MAEKCKHINSSIPCKCRFQLTYICPEKIEFELTPARYALQRHVVLSPCCIFGIFWGCSLMSWHANLIWPESSILGQVLSCFPFRFAVAASDSTCKFSFRCRARGTRGSSHIRPRHKRGELRWSHGLVATVRGSADPTCTDGTDRGPWNKPDDTVCDNLTAFGTPPALWPLASRPKVGVV